MLTKYFGFIVRRINFRDFTKIIIKKMVKQFIKKLTKKGAAIKFQMDRGMSNSEISRSLGVPESTVRYYRKRPDNLEIKRASKLPKKFIDEIYQMASNKTTREMPGGLIAIKINEKLKRQNIRIKMENCSV